MNAYKKKIFLTGAPSSGKTTVIRKIIDGLAFPATGFYTTEEKQGDKRVGFLMSTLDGKTAYLAHQDIQSDFRIRRYGVSISNIETLAVPSIKPSGNRIIILDEIGKMECFSKRFRQAALDALDSSSIVVGTVTLGGDEFIKNIKNRNDIAITEVTSDNRDLLPDVILKKISRLMNL